MYGVTANGSKKFQGLSLHVAQPIYGTSQPCDEISPKLSETTYSGGYEGLVLGLIVGKLIAVGTIR